MDKEGKDHVKFSSTSVLNDSRVYEPVSRINSKQQAAYLCPELSPPFVYNVGQKSQEVFQLKQRINSDVYHGKMSDMMKYNGIDNSPTKSLLSVIYGILDESAERKNSEIPLRVASLLRKVVQEIERRVYTLTEHMRTQSIIFKAREEKYQSRIEVLEVLATATSEETKSEKKKAEEKRKEEVLDLQRVARDKEEELQRVMKQKDEDLQKLVHAKEHKVVQEKEQELLTLVEEKEQKLLQGKEQELQRLVQVKEQNLEKELQRVVNEKEQKLEHEKDQELQRLVEDKKQELQRLVLEKEQILPQEKDQELQRLVEEKGEKMLLEKEQELQRLIHERVQKLMQEKDQEFQRLVEEKENTLLQEKEVELQRLMNEKMQKLMQEKDQEFQRLVEEKEQMLQEKDVELQRLKQAKGQNLVHEKEQELQRLLEEKEQKSLQEREQEFRRLVDEKEQKLLLEKAQDVQKLEQEKEQEMQRIIEEKEQKFLQEKEHELQRLVHEKEQKLLQEKEQDVQRLMQEKEQDIQRVVQEKEQDMQRLMKEKDELNTQMANLRQELEDTKQACEQQTLKTKEEAGGAQQLLEGLLKEKEGLLTDSRNRTKELEALQAESRNKIKELEALSESKTQWWNKKQHIYQVVAEHQLGALRELRFKHQTIQQDLVKTQKSYSQEFTILTSRFQILDNAAKSYYTLLAENQKIHNELQDLKGNIRVYCRIRPFLPGQKSKQTIAEHIGDNGELVVVNPSKQGKEGRRSFKFNKVYGPSATQAEVFSDTKPLIQSVLDGYNVCILAYGQTGSGKTYTMMGPDGGTEEEWGVNYRALNSLFNVSQSRESSFTYEISVQMVEIYNETVRDLLSNDAATKRLGIVSASQSSQSSGLAVPDASIHPVKSTSDVLELIDIGQNNRAKSSTAMNERSSRSHSVLSIHIRGTDLKSDSSLRGSLHLVDLAGSERVDRSEVVGDRLKEAQHINKSLSALGDVIFALSQKSTHIPYRNSKLTQVLQSSLGGQAKTLMFIQINPDAVSYSESLSTLKFAERVSGVELGAAKSSKDGRDVRELMEQVASLKDAVAKKDEEIEALQVQRDSKSAA